jgi:hypothetical protein
MLHILIDLGVLLAARRPSAVDETSSGSQPRSVSRVASSLHHHHRHTGEEHACNVHDHRRRGRLGRCFRRSGRRGDG